MTPPELKKQISVLRKKLYAEMHTGMMDSSFAEQLDTLWKEEMKMLEEALPQYRQKALMTKDLCAAKEVVVKDLSHLKECDLDSSV